MAKRKVVGFDEANARLTVPGAGDTYSLEKDVEMTAGVTIGGVQRNTWPSPGSSTVGIDDVLINGDVTNRRATLGGVDFAAVSSLMLPLTIVDYDDFDNSKDSAWIEKCSDKSWENETVYTGKQYLAATYANDAAALAANPSIVANDIYYNGTNFVLYSTSTVIYRASSRKFPMRGFVSVEAGRPIIWDATGGAPKLWAVGSTALGVVSSVTVTGNHIVIGSSTGVWEYDLFKARWKNYNATGSVTYSVSVFTTLGTAGASVAAEAIVNATVKSVALTYLPTAPLDEYGMRIETNVCGTAAGGSWITDSDLVWDATGAISLISTDIDSRGRTLFASSSKVYVYNAIPSADVALTAADYIFDTAGTAGPHIDGVIDSVSWAGDNIVVATSTGFFEIAYNESTPASSIVSKTTSAFSTGGEFGDTRRCYLANSLTADRSVKAGTLSVVGTVTETVNAGGRNVYSGFSAANYLQEASHADWNALGTGDFSIIMSGVKWGTAGTNRVFLTIGDGVSAGSIYWSIRSANQLRLAIHNGTNWTTNYWLSNGAYTDAAEHTVKVVRTAGILSVRVDGIEVAGTVTGTMNTTISNATGFFRIGGRQDASQPWTGGQCACVRLSATACTAEQSKFIAMQENALNGGTPCLLSNSSSVTDLRYSEEHDTYYVENGTNVDEFKGLVRNDYMTMATGVTASSEPLAAPYLSRSGTTNYWKAPAIDVNSQLKALALDNAELRQKPSTFGFNGDGATLSFSLQQGFKPQSVYVAGSRKFEGSTSDYTIGFDGFIYSVVFAVAPAVGTNNVVIEGVRV